MDSLNPVDAVYHELLSSLLTKAKKKENRTGTDAISIFGYQMRFDLEKQFPILTTKKVHFHSVLVELLWFLKGDTNVKYLQENKVTIWDEWATAEQTARFNRPKGELGPVYGHQWRNFGASKNPDGSYNTDGFDQIAWLVSEIKNNPNSRRLIISGWNPNEANQVALPPCHTLSQFYISEGKLSCQLYQRSADVFLGVPFNIASYALLTHIIAKLCNLEVGEFVWSGGDVHLYTNHTQQATIQLARTSTDCVPKLNVWTDDIFSLENYSLENYIHHPAIKAEVAI